MLRAPITSENDAHVIRRDGGTNHVEQTRQIQGRWIVPKDKFPRLRARWLEKYQDILSGVPERLPPLREINHRIELIDESMKYHYHLPRCPDALKPALMEKIERYVRAGWWEHKTVPQAAPMLCLVKRDNGLRTVFDCRKRNENTVKDVSPFPDQDLIRLDVARAPIRSKIDLSDAYEQIRIVPEDVWKTAFATVYGTMLSHVLQQGDCNGPATFQRLMTHIFRSQLGIFVHVYLDDIFVFSYSVEEHESHLGIVFELLRKHELFLKASKCDLYSDRMDCLGHIIDDRGLHADADKMQRVREWRVPRNYHEVQKFLGLVQYLAHFMPDVSSFTGPLAAITRNGHSFEWRPLHQRCFDTIKYMACKAPILRPIDPKINETIFVICDASSSGTGAMYGQGRDWHNCRPAGFMSRKFTAAQHAYRVFELETLAILEALMRWEDKLLGRKICIITDHEALKFFKTQERLSSRQARWMEYISRFDYEINYIQGELNKVADVLSRYYEYDGDEDEATYDEYVKADARLDPDGDDLPMNRLAELRAMRVQTRNSSLLTAKPKFISRQELEDRHVEAQKLQAPADDSRALETGGDSVNTSSPADDDEDPQPLLPSEVVTPLRQLVETDDAFLRAVRDGYASDVLFGKVLQNVGDHAAFSIGSDNLLWTRNRANELVMCIPRSRMGKKTIVMIVIEHAHTAIGHFGHRKTGDYVRRWYWWPSLGRDVYEFCKTCGICQTSKPSNLRPAGLLHTLPIPTRPWGSIAMDFTGPFLLSKGFDYLWVIICRLTSASHLIPVNTTIKTTELAWLYVREFVRLHGMADSIVSDRDSKFLARFWREIHRLLGTKLLVSTAFHPQIDGVTERVNRSINQLLRSMVRPDQTDWVERLPMVEFALNSAASSSTGFAPFELTGGALPRMTRELSTPSNLPGVQQFAENARDYLVMAHDSIIEARALQTHHANKRRRDESAVGPHHRPISVGDLVYLSTENLALPKGRARKLTPRFIGPYRVLKSVPSTSTYTLELPEDLARRGIHPTFHASLLRRHEPNDDVLFPHRDTQVYYDIGSPEDAEYVVDELMAHEWHGDELWFHVKWNLGDITLEPLANCNEL